MNKNVPFFFLSPRFDEPHSITYFTMQRRSVCAEVKPSPCKDVPWTSRYTDWYVSHLHRWTDSRPLWRQLQRGTLRKSCAKLEATSDRQNVFLPSRVATTGAIFYPWQPLRLRTTLGHSVYVSGPRAAYPILRDRGPRIIASARRVVCRSMQQRSASFKLAFEESNLLVVGYKLVVVWRVIPAQPKQRKGHSMRAFVQQPLLGVVIFRGYCDRTWPCTTVLRGTASEDGWGKERCAWRWNGVLETRWVRGTLDRELTKLHGVVVKRQREVTWANWSFMFACASAFSHQRCVHACTVSASCEKSNLGTVRTLRCVPSIASAAFLGQIEFLPRTCSTQFCRFGRKEEKKLPQTSLRRAQKRPRQMSELRSCRSQPVEELQTPFKHQHKACCPCESVNPFPGASSARESPRDRAKALHFSWCHALITLPNFTPVGSGPASLVYMAQQITCTRGAVGESGPAYIALCPNVVHACSGESACSSQPFHRGVQKYSPHTSGITNKTPWQCYFVDLIVNVLRRADFCNQK